MNYLEKAAVDAANDAGERDADQLWLQAATAALKQDDLEAALRYVRAALAYNPDNRLAEKTLGELSARGAGGR